MCFLYRPFENSPYALLRNLFWPVAPTSKTLQRIIEVFNAHFDLALLKVVERFKFNSHVRWPGESVANFIAESNSQINRSNSLQYPRRSNAKETAG